MYSVSKDTSIYNRLFSVEEKVNIKPNKDRFSHIALGDGHVVFVMQ